MKGRQTLSADENAGWVLLLPAPRPEDHALCIEINSVRNAEALAYWYPRVTALTFQRGQLQCIRSEFVCGRLESQNFVNWEPGHALPFADGAFTIVACRMTGGEPCAEWPLEHLVQTCARVVAPEGCLYIDIANQWAYRRLFALLKQVEAPRATPHSRFRLKRALRGSGFRAVRIVPYLEERGAIVEALPARGYRPIREGWKERAKALVLGRFGSRLLASSYGFIASRSALAETIVDGLQRNAHMAGLPAEPAFAGFRRLLIGTAKSFVRCEASDRSNPELMFVVPSRSEIVRRRRAEIAALALLQTSDLSIRRLLPNVAREFEHCGKPVFAYEFIPGETIDTITPNFAVLLRRAFELLRTFNRESIRRCRIGEAEFASIVGNALDSAAARYHYASASVTRLRAALAAHLLGSIVPVVWLHGDYKIENLIFDARSTVRAVIDWELSASIGLPLCDLLYLIAYVSVTYGQAGDLLEVFERTVLEGQFAAPLRAMFDAYIAEFSLSTNMIDVCMAAFLVHHVGYRYMYDPADMTARRRMLSAMSTLAERLEHQSARVSNH